MSVPVPCHEKYVSLIVWLRIISVMNYKVTKCKRTVCISVKILLESSDMALIRSI